jgi:hypothetical protein
MVTMAMACVGPPSQSREKVAPPVAFENTTVKVSSASISPSLTIGIETDFSLSPSWNTSTSPSAAGRRRERWSLRGGIKDVRLGL